MQGLSWSTAGQCGLPLAHFLPPWPEQGVSTGTLTKEADTEEMHVGPQAAARENPHILVWGGEYVLCKEGSSLVLK